jgi:hypothetical protein
VDADDREGPTGEHRHQPVAHGVEVVDEVALGGVGAVEEGRVEVGEVDPVTDLVGLGAHRARPYRRLATGRRATLSLPHATLAGLAHGRT